MRKRFTSLLLIVPAFLLGGPKLFAQSSFSVIHSFTSSTTDGANPEGQPMLFGSNLVGLAYNGGANGFGALFQVSTNGSGFNLLYSFEGDLNGANPFGLLAASGNSFYGMTFNGGIGDGGVIYRVRTNGTNYAVLHTFNGGNTDGQFPFGSLTVTGSTLFGMTANGGTNGAGVVFKIGTNGFNFTVLHSFVGTSDGSSPSEGVIISGTNLYGTAFFGGSNNIGTVFSMGTNGASFKVLHHFGTVANDGANPSGPLTLSGSSLYGITTTGGATNKGTVFTIGTDGTGYAVLHSFLGGANDGANPQFGPLIVTNNLIYGSTENGGSNSVGIVFQMTTSGTGFTILNSFGATATDGTFPVYPPILANANFYGMTTDGGSNNLGTVYGPGATSIVISQAPGCVTIFGTNSSGVLWGNVNAGELYTYQASGCAQNSTGPTITSEDPDGNIYTNGCSMFLSAPQVAGPGTICPGLIKFSLVGKFADGSCVQLGQNTNQQGFFVPPVSGPLTLFFNDDNFADNGGSFTACIAPTNLTTVCKSVGGEITSNGVSFGKVYAGFKYTVIASGSAAYDCPGSVFVNPDGLPSGVNYTGAVQRAAQNFACYYLFPFSLVGNLNGECIQLGSFATFTAPSTGNLVMLMNDSATGFFNNNCGGWSVCLIPLGDYRITAIASTNSSHDILVTWNTPGGVTNFLQVTPGDAQGNYNSNGFVNLSGPIIIPGPSGISTNYLDIGGATNRPNRYYRVRLIEP